MFAPAQQSELTLYTDAYIVRGTVETRERRVSDILNHAERRRSSSCREASLDEYGSRSIAVTVGVRPGQPRERPVRGRQRLRRAGAGAADAEGPRRRR